MDITGIGGILTNLLEKMLTDRRLQRWWRFSVSLILTILIVFPFTAGTVYLTGVSGWRSIASACVATSLCLFLVYRSSPLAQDLMIGVPKGLVEEVQEHPDEVLIAGKDAEKK